MGILPARGVAVECVPQYGRIKPLGMGGVNSQLMGASGVEDEFDTGDALAWGGPCLRWPTPRQDFKVGLAGLALLPIYLLSRGLVGVGAEG